jgi:hypothetical protein
VRVWERHIEWSARLIRMDGNVSSLEALAAKRFERNARREHEQAIGVTSLLASQPHICTLVEIYVVSEDTQV